jgi:hypothetical protein
MKCWTIYKIITLPLILNGYRNHFETHSKCWPILCFFGRQSVKTLAIFWFPPRWVYLQMLQEGRWCSYFICRNWWISAVVFGKRKVSHQPLSSRYLWKPPRAAHSTNKKQGNSQNKFCLVRDFWKAVHGNQKMANACTRWLPTKKLTSKCLQ